MFRIIRDFFIRLTHVIRNIAVQIVSNLFFWYFGNHNSIYTSEAKHHLIEKKRKIAALEKEITVTIQKLAEIFSEENKQPDDCLKQSRLAEQKDKIDGLIKELDNEINELIASFEDSKLGSLKDFCKQIDYSSAYFKANKLRAIEEFLATNGDFKEQAHAQTPSSEGDYTDILDLALHEVFDEKKGRSCGEDKNPKQEVSLDQADSTQEFNKCLLDVNKLLAEANLDLLGIFKQMHGFTSKIFNMFEGYIPQDKKEEVKKLQQEYNQIVNFVDLKKYAKQSSFYSQGLSVARDGSESKESSTHKAEVSRSGSPSPK